MSEEEGKINTVRFDPRFPHINQTLACFRYYSDFYKCQRLLGEDHEPCELLRTLFQRVCPNEWVAKWDEQRAEGVFPGRL